MAGETMFAPPAPFFLARQGWGLVALRHDAVTPPRVMTLEESSDRFAGHSEAYYSASRVHFGDRVRWDQSAMAREEAALDGQRVRDVGGGAVHRTLDLAHHPPAVVGDWEARGVDKIQRKSRHGSNLIPD